MAVPKMASVFCGCAQLTTLSTSFWVQAHGHTRLHVQCAYCTQKHARTCTCIHVQTHVSTWACAWAEASARGSGSPSTAGNAKWRAKESSALI